MTETKRIHVAVGVIENAEGEILIARRREGQHLAGLWEFPGGKLEKGEDASEALCRELYEELGVKPSVSSFQFAVDHRYSEKSVSLLIFHVTEFSGEPRGQEGQEIRWVSREGLCSYPFPDANQKILAYLKQ